MWTADAATYERVFVEMLDFHLRLTDETTGNPSAFRSRFNADGSYWLWDYERRRTPAEFERLIARIAGRAHQRAAQHAGLLLRRPAGGGGAARHVLRRAARTPTRAAFHPGRRDGEPHAAPRTRLALGRLRREVQLARHLRLREPRSERAAAARDHEIYWCTGPDGQRVLMKWHSWARRQPDIGGYAEAFDPGAAVEYLDGDRNFFVATARPARPEPYRVRGAFGFGWDALDRKTGSALRCRSQAAIRS